MIDKQTLDHIHRLLEENKFDFVLDAEMDLLKQNYDWGKDFIIDCLKKGKKYTGSEIYPDIKERYDRYYCMHKYSILSSKIALIGFLVLKNILIIHICRLNKGSKEGRIYYNL